VPAGLDTATTVPEWIRHTTPSDGDGHAKLRIGESVIEIGEHPSGNGRPIEPVPRVGLRLYVADVIETYRRATAAGGTGDPPTERPPGTAATVHDSFGLTSWLAATIPDRTEQLPIGRGASSHSPVVGARVRARQ
jgi:uncharacterized glyoxalase superfamily protein PhnB